nr:hypothetical protein [Tanacetum cinerariifolium]
MMHHEVRGRVDGQVEEVEGLENQQTELVVKLVTKMVREVTEILGYSYKEFMACSLKYYDGKDGAIVYTRWIEKMEPVQEMSGCGVNQKVKAGHGAYSDRFHVLARLVPYLVTPENKRIERYIYGLALQIRVMVVATKPTIIQSVVLKAGMLTDEAIRPSRDSNVRDDPKRSRTKRAFTLTTNPIRREYTSAVPKCTNCNFHHHPEMPYHTCTKYNRLGHFSKECRVGPRMATTANAKNSTAARRACFVCGGWYLLNYI